MKKLAAVMVCVLVLAWASLASAQTYSALDDMTSMGPYIGIGGLMMTGNNGAGDNDSAFLPTVNISGITDYVAWQAFYGMSADSHVFGGSVDYILASNFDDCFTCPELGKWWFGVGGTAMSTSALYFDDTDASAAIDKTLFGGNLGFGYIWDRWMLNLYGHVLTDSQYGIQAAIMYDVTK
jgi:hypothetical protein